MGKGQAIAKRIMEKYDNTDFEVEKLEIEKEVYERALHEATGFLLDSDENLEKELESSRAYLETRVDASKRKMQKLSTKEVLANLIKVYAIDTLEEHELYLL